jgi:cysteine desulfurase
LVQSPLYLDYNATSPLAELVKTKIGQGNLFFANPASQHQAGKAAKKAINQASSFIYEHFNLTSATHRLVFHSGATEGVNTVIQGLYQRALNEGKKFTLLVSPLDHPCVLEAQEWLEHRGAEFIFYPINEEGEILFHELETLIKEYSSEKSLLLINYTWVHNETGVIWDLSALKSLKDHHVYLHVDAVQSVGKTSDYQKLLPEVDFYTYSGHKFGALKGIGFSFHSTRSHLPPLVWGGGQQQGYRSGTENVHGIQSLHWALTEYQEKWNPIELQKIHSEFENDFKKILEGKGEILFSHSKRNLNTTYFYLNSMASDMALALFDLGGLQISSGSACASGAAKKSEVMRRVGLEKLARNGLRISHGPFMTKAESQTILELLQKVISKI